MFTFDIHIIIFSVFFFILGILISYFLCFFKKRQKFLEQEKFYVDEEYKMKIKMQDLEHELFLCRQKYYQCEKKENTLLDVQKKLFLAEERITILESFRKERDDLSHQLQIQRDVNIRQESELKVMILRLEDLKCVYKEKKQFLIYFEEKFHHQLENLINNVFERSSHKIDKQNISSVNQLLIPLREQIDIFRKQIQDNFFHEGCERHTLSHEIHNLHSLSIKMMEETVNLTNALKYNNKLQGCWGEVILSRVLESSGMREGYEFHSQVRYEQENGCKLQPDVVVHLPNGRDIVIDAKMSLLAYEKYFNSSDKMYREKAMDDHISSLRSHIKIIGNKNYEQLVGVKTLDYILLFIPIEPAFIVAIDRCPELINEAISHNIMLVSPSTLLVALRTINNLWRYEYQNRNAQKIAKKASRLYDKIRLFIDDFNKIGQILDKFHVSYRFAKRKLFEGNANIVSQVEEFRCLGVDIKTPIINDVKSNVIDN